MFATIHTLDETMNARPVARIALIAALLLPLAGTALADTVSKYSVTSSSYKSGFSSQKSSSSRSSKASKPSKSFGSFSSRKSPGAPAPDNSAARNNGSSNNSDSSSANNSSNANSGAAPKRGGFGSFGTGAAVAGGAAAAGAAAAQDAPPSSGMSKDLERSQQQANARKTLDERTANANALPPLNNRVPGQDGAPRNDGQPGYNQPMPQPYNQPNQPPVVVQQNDGFGKMVVGFMLGRALSGSGNHNYYPGNGNSNSNGQAMPVGTAQMPAAPQTSFLGGVLRIFAWLVLLGLIGWLVFFALRFFKRGKQASRANYSFERK